ncbi:MAG: RNA-binding domain-containing protein [Methanobacteriota archaeon]
MIRIAIAAPVKPTESAERVSAAIRNLFPDAALATTDREVAGTATDLDRFGERLRSQRIPDTARGILLRARSADGTRTRFSLAKQAAAAGKVSFATVPSALGDIDVEVKADSPEALQQAILWAAPDTTRPHWEKAYDLPVDRNTVGAKIAREDARRAKQDAERAKRTGRPKE